MDDFFLRYTEGNLICVIIFAILLAHDLFNADRSEKQIKYDDVLIAFIFYFIADIFWAALETGRIEKNLTTVIINTLCLYVGMELITFTWLEYVMSVEQVPHRNRPINKFAVIFPFLVSTVVLIAVYLIKPSILINESLEIQPGFNPFLVGASYINIAAIMFYAIRKAVSEEDPIEKRKHLLIGLFPLLVIAGGLLEMLFFPHDPIFCFCSTILMLVFFIQMMERQISVDPLTGLNNRSQLLRYVAQKNNTNMEERLTYVLMIDINDFKAINDTYGHAEGDKALIILSDSLKKAIGNHNMPVFLGRFGGDEFIMIVHPQNGNEMEPFVNDIRTEIENECRSYETPYVISIGIGYDELKDDPDTFQKCMQRADKKLYLDKEYIKLHREKTAD